MFRIRRLKLGICHIINMSPCCKCKSFSGWRGRGRWRPASEPGMARLLQETDNLPPHPAHRLPTVALTAWCQEGGNSTHTFNLQVHYKTFLGCGRGHLALLTSSEWCHSINYQAQTIDHRLDSWVHEFNVGMVCHIVICWSGECSEPNSGSKNTSVLQPLTGIYCSMLTSRTFNSIDKVQPVCPG